MRINFVSTHSLETISTDIATCLPSPRAKLLFLDDEGFWKEWYVCEQRFEWKFDSDDDDGPTVAILVTKSEP